LPIWPRTFTAIFALICCLRSVDGLNVWASTKAVAMFKEAWQQNCWKNISKRDIGNPDVVLDWMTFIVPISFVHEWHQQPLTYPSKTTILMLQKNLKGGCQEMASQISTVEYRMIFFMSNV